MPFELMLVCRVCHARWALKILRFLVNGASYPDEH